MKKKVNLFLLSLLFLSLLTAQNKSEIKFFEGVPALYLNEKLYPPIAYVSYLPQTKYYKEIAETGIHLYSFTAYLGDEGINAQSKIKPFRTHHVWVGENEYDFTSVIEDFEKIIKTDPQAKIFIRLYLDPPYWWVKKNPDASTHLADGTTFRQSFYSKKWRNETGTVLEVFIKWILNSRYSKYLIGIQPAAGGTEEWYYHSPQRNDKNPLRLIEFRKWLKNKYNDDVQSLQSAWGNKNVTFANASLSSTETSEKRWRVPIKEQNTVDMLHFQSEVIVQNIEHFCKIVKNVSNGNLLAGVFYGAHYSILDSRYGHGALERMLKCDYLDFLSSPNMYNRVIGEDWPPQAAAMKSIQKHGKLWLIENDTRTCRTTLLPDQAPWIPAPGTYNDGVWLGPDDMETSEAFLWKNIGRMLTQGYGGWWFDMWGGWFSDPKLLSILGKSKQLFTEYPQKIGTEMQPEVCLFVDEQLQFWDMSYGNLTEQIYSNRYPLGKVGTPHDIYLRTDFANISTDQYKVIWLMGFLELKDAEVQKVREWQKQGKIVLWTDGDGTHKYFANSEDYIDKFKQFSDSQLRNIFKNAGVHIYSDSGDVLYIGRNWLCIHTIFGGKKTINLPFFAKVINVINDQKYSDSTNLIEIEMSSKSTVLLYIDPI